MCRISASFRWTAAVILQNFSAWNLYISLSKVDTPRGEDGSVKVSWEQKANETIAMITFNQFVLGCWNDWH